MKQDPEKVNYNAFGEDFFEPEKNGTSGLKISNKIQPKTKPTTADFESAISAHNKSEIASAEKISKATLQYKAMINDHTLIENKTPLSKNLESESIKTLTEIATALNTDQNQPEGIGAVGLCSLLLQVNLIQRDQINKLNFELSKMKKILLDITTDGK